MTLTVFLASALLCMGDRCWPALVGPDTPTGRFEIHRRYVQARGYGGDVLQFAEDDKYIFAIHRVWLGNPKERRLERLTSGDASQRRTITHGCINVLPEVYDQIVGADAVEIRP
jgi:hypothetical protein